MGLPLNRGHPPSHLPSQGMHRYPMLRFMDQRSFYPSPHPNACPPLMGPPLPGPSNAYPPRMWVPPLRQIPSPQRAQSKEALHDKIKVKTDDMVCMHNCILYTVLK